MDEKIIYLDHAATSWPKPPSVIRSVSEALHFSGNPGRGSHPLAAASSRIVYDCRQEAAELFGADEERVVFTMNATQALNMAIKGLVRRGDHILYDNLVHNAVYRPIVALTDRGICTADSYNGVGSPEAILHSIRQKLRKNTTTILATHQSNICSSLLPIEEIGHFCRAHGLHFIVDASQSAGHRGIHVDEMGITALCMPGHKGLFGPMGVGMLIAGKTAKFSTILEGGTGIYSLEKTMPAELPERLEAGTAPVAAIAGLTAGMKTIKEIGLSRIHKREEELGKYFTEELRKMDGVQIFGNSNGSVVSFKMEGTRTAELTEQLGKQGICVRGGFHCAPVAHRTLGTGEDGTVRVSFSFMNSYQEVEEVLRFLKLKKKS